MTFSAAALDWLTRTIGIAGDDVRSLNIVRMKGSTSSSVFLIQCPDRSRPQRFVLRLPDNPEWLAAEPDLAAHEAAALEEAREAGLSAPRLVAYSADDVGFGAPAVLMSFLEGRILLRPTDFQAWLDSLARELASIHRHPADAFAWRYGSWVDEATLAPPDWAASPRTWERAIELVREPAPEARPVFIHRDYHPTNVLWINDAVSGVVDWINACRGPAGVDVAHCRLNLALMYGLAAADQFLTAYRAVAAGFDYHPYWDLDSVFDMCLPQPPFYPPWQDFGLDPLLQAVLNQRVDAYLESLMRRL